MRQVHSTINSRCIRNTLHQRHQGTTVDRLPSGSQFDQNTPSPGTGSSTFYKDPLMSSKGSIRIKPQYLSHSQPTRSNHIQSIVCRNKSTPVSKKNVKLFILVTLLSRGYMTNSDEERVEIFSWSWVRMEHLIDKISPCSTRFSC